MIPDRSAATAESSFVVPAKAGTHSSNAREADKWIPACGEMTTGKVGAIFAGGDEIGSR